MSDMRLDLGDFTNVLHYVRQYRSKREESTPLKVKPTTFDVLPSLLFTAWAAQYSWCSHTILRPRNLEVKDSCTESRVEAMIVICVLVRGVSMIEKIQKCQNQLV